MIELAVLVSAFFANKLTGFVKAGEDKVYLTQEEIDARKAFLRIVNAFAGAAALVLSAWAVGEPLDVTGFKDALSSAGMLLFTFAVSQAGYFLSKRN